MRFVRESIVAFLGLAALTGCPELLPNPGLPPNTDYDGSWQLTTTTRGGVACISIKDGRIVTWNDGCTNNFQTIADSQEVSVAGDIVVFTLTTSDSTGGSRITLNTRVQSNGNLSGSITIDDGRGNRFTDSVVVVKR